MVKIRFMLAVGGLIDIFYLKTVLKKYQLVKEKFALEIEQG